MASKAREKRKGNGGFLLGMITGIAAGVSAGTVLLRQLQAPREEEAFIMDVAEREPDGSTVQAEIVGVRQTPPTVADSARGAVDALKQRWQDALAEGKVAAAEREAELYEKLATDMKRSQVHLIPEQPSAPPSQPSGD